MPKHNLTPFVCYHIPSSLLLSHFCHWFYFDRKPEEETALFSPPFLLQTRLSLCLIIVPDSRALIKALHLTNTTNDFRSQKQMESSQSKTGRGWGALRKMSVFCICFVLIWKSQGKVGFYRSQSDVESNNLQCFMTTCLFWRSINIWYNSYSVCKGNQSFYLKSCNIIFGK